MDNGGFIASSCSLGHNFRVWAFLHDDLPSLWREPAQLAAGIEPHTVTETCRLSNQRLVCENAHIIPAAEKS